jgi:hypothetical protein
MIHILKTIPTDVSINSDKKFPDASVPNRPTIKNYDKKVFKSTFYSS